MRAIPPAKEGARETMAAPPRTSCRTPIDSFLAALWLVLVVGCGSAEQQGGALRTDSAPPAGSAEIGWPGPGDARIALTGNRVEVLSNEAPRLSVLRRLATVADFELEVGDAEDQPLSVHIEPTDLRLAVPILAGDLRYRVDYAFDAERGGHVLRRLEIGAPASSGVGLQQWGRSGAGEERTRSPDRRAPGRAGVSPVQGIGRALATAIGEDGRERFEEEDVEREVLEALGSRDPEARASAAEEIDPEGNGLARLLTLALDDPDPKVRAVATAQLADGDSFGAMSGLLDALGDPDRMVVLEAIEGLSATGDSSVLFALEPLRRSRDAEIRSAAEEAIDSLEF
jgi:hypothetical protein